MRLGTTVTSFRSPHRTFYLGSTWLYEAWCTVGRHEPSLLALLAYQDSPHISANEMLRHKLKTVLLTALLTVCKLGKLESGKMGPPTASVGFASLAGSLSVSRSPENPNAWWPVPQSRYQTIRPLHPVRKMRVRPTDF